METVIKTLAKYLVCPNYVIFKNDNQRHFISYNQLIRAYNVNPDECVLYDPQKDASEYNGLVILTPQYDGDMYLIDIGVSERT